MDNLKIEYIDIDELVPYENNAKLHPKEQIQQIKKSIELYGMNDPIGVWKDNQVIEGHGRLLACKELHIDTVPIIRLDHLNDKERREYMLVHNQLTMNSDFDIELLELELQDLDFDGFDFDFDLPEDEVKPERKDLSDDFSETFEIIITCKDEDEQEQLFMQLQEEGYECRLSTL